MTSYHDGRPRLEPFEKVTTIVGLTNGVMPHWADRGENLYKIICALTGMSEVEAKTAIQQADSMGPIEYVSRTD